MTDVIVVGAGVIGLTTALELCHRGCSVQVWTRDDPKDTVSAVAGAIWYPFLAEPRERVLGWSAVTFRRLRELGLDPATGVHMQTVVEVFGNGEPEVWWQSAVGAIERLPAALVPKPYKAAIRLEVPVCDTTVYLPWLLDAVRSRGGRVVRREVASLDEPLAEAGVVVNCTGLGAVALCGDREMQAVRGQVVVVEHRVLPHALLDDSSAQPFYAIPRRHDVVLGGTAQVGDRRVEPDARDTADIVAGMTERLPVLQGVKVRAVRVGLRPYRSAVRLEFESRAGGQRVVHNYGHGGSGYTLAWGCAEEVAALLPAGSS